MTASRFPIAMALLGTVACAGAHHDRAEPPTVDGSTLRHVQAAL